jgi:hypothetical protein
MRRTAVAAALALLLCPAAPAADYYFQVRELLAEVTVRPDAKVELRYAITFTPQAGSHAVDIVDIGMPNDEYDLGSARAAVDGAPLADIRNSEYVKPGVEVHLGNREIAPGGTGTLEFSILLPRLVFADSGDESRASLQFKSTWYDAKYVAGNAERIEIRLNLPPGTKPGDARYHAFGRSDYQPSETLYENDRVAYRWLWEDRPATVPYAVGASFPRALVTGVTVPSRPSILKALFTAVFAFIAFVLSLTPLWIVVLLIVFAVRSNRRRLQRYLPPRVGIESAGIKRGLAPAEAALLQELPLAKVLLLVVFGLLKKDRIAIKEVAAGDFRFHELKKEGLELQEYEKGLIAAIDKENRLDKAALRRMFTAMIAALEKKMAGFSRRETNQYFQSIMNKAWEQVRNCPREKLPGELDEALEWLALDPEYETKLDPIAGDMVFPPGSRDHWYRHFPQRSPGGGGTAIPGRGFGQTVSGAAPSQRGGAAANLVGSLQAFSGALLGDGAAFTSAITRVTNPPPAPARGGSGGHSGGGGCACACACAGCACACAGGGR